MAEEYDCEKVVDICVGTLSKAAGCQGGFIACRCHVSLCPESQPVNKETNR